MHLIGRGRYAREVYPEANRGVSALSNRYLTSPIGPASPDAFTATGITSHVVAAVNVTRRASGLFMVSVQVPATLAAPDTQEWVALAFFGSTVSGGTPYGDWLIGKSSLITLTPPTGASATGEYIDQRGAGNLTSGITLVGVNTNPVPPGQSAIVVLGETLGSTQITPGLLFAVAYELP